MRASRLPIVLTAFAAARAAAAPPAPAPAPPPPPALPAARPELTAPLTDLPGPPPIAWASVALRSEADALALWARLAPTGADFEDRLHEIPAEPAITRPLARALLHAGHFQCPASPPPACATAVPPPAADATLADPCLRRRLVPWALAQLAADPHSARDPVVRDALRALAALPAPDAELALAALRTAGALGLDADARLELFVRAARAGHDDLVRRRLDQLDEAHWLRAVTRDHVGVALERLDPGRHRAAYLAAIVDDAVAPAARTRALDILRRDVAPTAPLPADLERAATRAAASPTCEVAAYARALLAAHGARASWTAMTCPHHPTCTD